MGRDVVRFSRSVRRQGRTKAVSLGWFVLRLRRLYGCGHQVYFRVQAAMRRRKIIWIENYSVMFKLCKLTDYSLYKY